MENKIKIERQKAGITQQKLGEEVGASRQLISLIEKGKAVPNTNLAVRIAKFFKKKLEEIFCLEDSN
jgi:putative transcriptional regulator